MQILLSFILLLALCIPATAQPAEFTVRAGTLPLPAARPGWLGNDSPRPEALIDGAMLHLRVTGAGTGMKWSTPLRDWPDLSPYHYVTVRYRARGFAQSGDYFLWLGSDAGGAPQQSRTLAPLTEVASDDRWQTAIFAVKAPFRPAEMAFQVQSLGESAEVWIDTLRFTTEYPLLPVAETLPLAPGHAKARIPLSQAHPVDLAPLANTRAAENLRRFGLSEWPRPGAWTIYGIPFQLAAGERDALITPPDIRQTLSIPLQGSASEIYLLMASRLPDLDLARVGDGIPMRRFDAPERLVFRVTYADGVTDAIFPIRLGSSRYEVATGADIYCLSGLRRAPLRSLSLCNQMRSGVFLVGAVTLNSGKPLTPRPAVAALPPAVPAQTLKPGPGRIARHGDGFQVSNNLLRLELQTKGGISLRGADNRCLRGGTMRLKPGPLFTLGLGDKRVSSLEVTTGTATVRQEGKEQLLAVPVDATTAGVPLKGEFTCAVGEGADIRLGLRLTLTGDKPATPIVHFPLINGVTLGSAADTWYLWGCKGGLVNHVSCTQRQYYGGEYPIQVADFFNPGLGGGLTLATYDRKNIYKQWRLDKTDSGGNWRIEYFPREYQPGEEIEIAPTALRAHRGDWREALQAYRRWVAAWYHPQTPRKPWFQRCFNYRQHWAWSDLRDQKTGKWRMEEVIAADREFFGCLDYLHIFDFGQSKKYGRVGDYNHYDELGGREAMAEAIATAQRLGVPVGLYFEGYLCDERGVWGRENVLRYDIRAASGKSLLWTGTSPEHMMCPASEGWRNHLGEVYHRVAEELHPNGMYIDQYGFLNTWKICYARDHGHTIPAAPLRGEADALQTIRAAVPPQTATLTEETPCDVNSQYQDGSLGYSVTWADAELAPHRVDLFRFLFPDYKVFQLVSYSSFADGNWFLLKWPFFNGEGTWSQNSVQDGFSTEARDFLRRSFAILHRYADAFTSADVEPLTPTLIPTVYANRFTGPRQQVWTLFNAEYRTMRGNVLRLPAKPGARYRDAFTDKEIQPRRVGKEVLIPVELGPRAVGCVVEETGK